ncbi:hypothetical protein D3C84_624380 [compost metagenome]
MVLHPGAFIKQVSTGIHIGGVRIGDGLGGVFGLKKPPYRLIPGTLRKAESGLRQGRLSHPADDRFGKHFLVAKNAVYHTHRSATDRQDQRRVVGVGGVFLRRPATALATRLFLGSVRDGFEVGVINQVGADAVSAGEPGDRFAARAALNLQRVDACGAVRDRGAAAPHR